MNEIKTLADQLRNRMAKPDTPDRPAAVKKKAEQPPEIPDVVERIRDFDIAGNKSLVHARFDAQTAQMLHHLKMAAGIEVTRLICFSVQQLFEKYPELKTIIKEHLEKLKL